MSGIVGTSSSKSKVVGRSQDTAKAWVNMTADTTVNDAFNVSSVSSSQTGDYTINFITPMRSTNYAVSGLGKSADTSTNLAAFMQLPAGVTSPLTTTSARVQTMYDNETLRGCTTVTLIVFGE